MFMLNPVDTEYCMIQYYIFTVYVLKVTENST